MAIGGLGLGLASEARGLTAEVALLIGLTSLLGLPILSRVIQRQFDPFEPLVIFVVAWSVMFIARPAAMLVTNSFEISTYPIRPGFVPMLVLAGLGAFGFLTGYFLPFGDRIGRRMHPLPNRWSAPRALLFSIVLSVVGLSLFLAFIAQVGGVGALTQLLTGRDERQLLFISSSTTGYFYEGIMLGLPAGLLVLATAFQNRRLGLGVVSALMLALPFLEAAPSGIRSTLLPIVGAPIVLMYLRKGRRPGPVALALFLSVTFVVGIAFVGAARNTGLRQAFGSRELLAQSATHLGDSWNRFVLGGDTEMAGLLSLEIMVVPGQIPFQYGGATGEVFLQPIPRILWNSKPRPGDEVLTKTLFVDPNISVASRQYSPLADFYLDFAFPGAALGMALLGILARLHYSYLKANAENASHQLLYALTMPFWFILLRGSIADTAARLLFVVPPLLVGLYFARRASIGSPEYTSPWTSSSVADQAATKVGT